MPGVTNATAGVLACAEALVVADKVLDPAGLINPNEALVAADGILDPAIAIDTGEALVVADKVLDSAGVINPNEAFVVDDGALDPARVIDPTEVFDPDGLVVPSEVFDPVKVSDPTAEVDAAAEFTVPDGAAIAFAEGVELLAEAELNVGERVDARVKVSEESVPLERAGCRYFHNSLLLIIKSLKKYLTQIMPLSIRFRCTLYRFI